jgi:hypothetical protein
MASTHANRRIRQRWMWLGLVAVIAVLVYQLSGLVAVPGLLADDYVEYWAAGRLNLTHGNPYAADQLLPLERGAGRTTEVLMMWNPPWTLALAMPLSLLSYPISRLLWLGLSIVAILISANWTWTLFGGAPPRRWLAWALAFAFFPTIIVLRMGQIGPVLLLGVAGFLHFEHKKRYWLAGAFVALLAVKPHLLYLVFLAILVWSVRRRQRWAILGGAAVLVFVATAAAMLVNPQVTNQYLDATGADSPLVWMNPTLGSLLRLLLGPEKTWLQFAPMVVGVVWLVLYGMKHRRRWLWADRISLLLLVSVLTAPFGWPFDQVVLIPVVLYVACRVLDAHDRQTAWMVATPYLIINVVAFALHGRVSDFWQSWFAPAMLVWYLVARRLTEHASKTELTVAK